MQIFNATDYDPEQGLPKHPVGMGFDTYISNTEYKPGKDGNGRVLVVTFTTQQGSIQKQYGIEQENEEWQNIARRQLSALCHSVKTYQINFATHAAELRNKQLKIDVAVQDKDAKYNHVAKVYDSAGNAPTKAAPMSAPQGGMAAPQPNFGGQNAAAQPNFAPQTAMQQPQFQQPAQQFAPQAMQAPQALPQQMQQPPAGLQGQPMPTQKPDWAK